VGRKTGLNVVKRITFLFGQKIERLPYSQLTITAVANLLVYKFYSEIARTSAMLRHSLHVDAEREKM
jgi:hypothetical protein